MTHLGPEELIDAMDGALDAARRGHLDSCDQCRREAAALRALLVNVRATDMPEPSPLFWDRFSARVREAIDDDTPARAPRWFEWPVLAPLGAFALLVFAVVASVPGGPPSAPAGVQAVQSAASEPDARIGDLEAQWAVVADMVGELDVDAARDAGIAMHPGVADRAVLGLSASEQQELIRLLREELRVGG